MYTRILERFISLHRVPLKVVVITALASWAMQLGAVLQGQPLWVIALFTLIPWIPLVVFEGLWKYEHYNYMAVFAVIAVLQVGHLGEHAFQVTQLRFLNGTIACPPPLDNGANAARAQALGLRTADQGATGRDADSLVQPAGKAGNTAKLDAQGREITGPPACGVFGRLDFETIHLVWDTAVWIGALWLLTRFPTNPFLWVAVFAASAHELEHLFLGYIFFFDTAKEFTYSKQLWGTVLEGKRVIARPVGTEQVLEAFYEVGGKTGLLGRNGMLETLVLGTRDALPIRPYLHWWYNTAVVIPTVAAFLVQVRRVYDAYLAKALPELTEEQLIRTTPRLQRETFTPGQVIVRQNDPADKFYIITRGQVEVVRQQDTGGEIVVNRLGPGMYFGEIGLLHGGRRIATVRATENVETLSLDRGTFSGLMTESEMSKEELDRVVRSRVLQVKAMEHTPVGR
ncbi:MAG: cyclic nucleotide-binding domain-containing protein [Dehalococcoidia bacterium]